MFGIFERRILYVKFYEDRIEIRDIKKDKNITRHAQKTYSNDRLLIANFQNAELELRQAVLALKIKNQRFNRLVFVFQPFHSKIRDFSEVELRTFIDSSEHGYATEVYLYLKTDHLSDSKILQEANPKFSFFQS